MGESATVGGLFERILAEEPGLPALIQDGDTMTFAGWWAESARAAGVLAERGVRRGDVVGLLLPSGRPFAVWYLATVRLGAVVSGINPRLGSREVAHIVGRLRPKVVVGGLGRVPPDLSLGESLTGDGPAIEGCADASPGAPVVIVWTTGTTGLPKGAWFDDEALRFIGAHLGPLSAPYDRKLMPIPFAHAGYTTRLYDQLVHRSALVLTAATWTAEDMLETMVSERVTVGQGVPTQWEKLLALDALDTADLSALRLVSTGAGRVPGSLVMALRERLGRPVVVRYASTEVPLAFGTGLSDPADVAARSVGSALGGAEVEITSPSGTALPAGCTGRVRIRSRAAMRGYWRDPAATEQVLRPDGWVVTSDLGSLDAAGNLTIVGRADDVYIRGGYNVHPAEVEAVLGSHPQVAQVAVVGVDAPVIGEIGVAFVVAATPRDLDPEEVRDWCRGRIADYKVPDIVVSVPDLPVNSTYKVDVGRLREMAARLSASR